MSYLLRNVKQILRSRIILVNLKKSFVSFIPGMQMTTNEIITNIPRKFNNFKNKMVRPKSAEGRPSCFSRPINITTSLLNQYFSQIKMFLVKLFIFNLKKKEFDYRDRNGM